MKSPEPDHEATLPEGMFPSDNFGTAAAVPITEGPGSIIGRYKLLQQIGEGGFGVVYMAEQTEPVTRRVALKIIKLGMDTRQVIARFEAERQALALMDHPNIAKVLDAGATDSGRPYFVMELVRGIPITEYCDKNHLSARERLELFIPVCQAIQHAHQKGIIHRDIKPSNVLITLHDGKPIPMVIDFGIAKATNQKLTEKTLFTNFGAMIGTPAYMSPEQAEMSKLDVDTRSDIYSLGVLLYELLTGTTPFPDKRLRSVGYGEMQRIISEEEPERPSTRLAKTTSAAARDVTSKKSGIRSIRSPQSAIDPDLDWIVMKCLEKDRTRRYETAALLANDIERQIANQPVHARPPSASYRSRKFLRRNRVPLFSIGAVIGGILLGIFAPILIKQRSIETKLGPRLSSPEPRPIENLEAYNLYLKGKLFYSKWTQDSLNLAINYLNQAIALEPNFPLALAALAEVQITGLYYSGNPVKLLPIIRRSAERALALQPDLPDAHYSMGLVNLHERKWKAAETNFVRALTLNPDHTMSHDAYAWLLAGKGFPENGLVEMRRAHQLDPLSGIINPDLAFLLMFADKYDEAIQQCHEALKMDSVNFQSLDLLGMLYSAKGNFDEARKFYELATLQNANDPSYRPSWEASLAAAHGNKEECVRLLAPLKRDYGIEGRGAGAIARMYVVLGDNDAAFDWANRACDAYDPYILWLQVNREWDPVRKDPRYARLLKRLGFERQP